MIPIIITTIDTENPQTPFRQGKVSKNLIDPEVNGDTYGARRLADIFKHNNIKATFFITTSEKYIFEESFYRELCQHLHSQGHEIGIHSHPEWMVKDGRIHMWELSFEDQLEKLSEMKNDILSWTGTFPVSHRAGAYGMDFNTIRALEVLDIPIDSSMFLGDDNCKVQYSHNRAIRIKNTKEFPVTGFYKVLQLSVFRLKVKLKRTFIKTDIETCSLDELIWFFDHAEQHDIQFINLFMHSYSLIDLNDLPDISVNNNEQKLHDFYKYVQRKGGKSMTLKEYSESLKGVIEVADKKISEKVPYLVEEISLKDLMLKIIKKFVK